MANHSRRNVLKTFGTAAALVACGIPRLATAQAKLQPMDIYIGTTPHFGNIIVGAEKGFFEKEGLPVKITNFASGSVAADAFRTGKGSILVAGDLPSIRLWQQGFIGLCPQAHYNSLSIIVAQGHVKSASDLKGRKVGVLLGSTSEYFTKLYLSKAGMSVGDIDLYELNEAFAAVVLRFVREMGDGRGALPLEKVNVNGGAIAMGHPLGATGAMLIGTIVDELERRDLRRGLVTLCVGGGMGIATIVERV